MENRLTIIVVDDEESIRTVISAQLEKIDYNINTFSNAKEALDFLSSNTASVMISDIKMSPIDGIDLLKEAKRIDPDLVVILITAYSSKENAQIAMKLGAFDYVEKPFKMDHLRFLVKRGIELRKTLEENRRLKGKLELGCFHNIIGRSLKMKKVYNLIELVAIRDTTVLITGESGTGKELVARCIHDISPKNKNAFVVVNCAAIPETLLESELFGHKKGSFTGAISDKNGLFQEADKGTIFLDEISSMPLNLQVKLLRVIQEKEVRMVGDTKVNKINVRVVAASNENLEELVREKAFREDLYYRLNVVPVNLPPLRERKEDIPYLAEHFLKSGDNSQVYIIAPEAMKLLIDYDWPGNIRELENVIERLKVLCPKDKITPDMFPENFFKSKMSFLSDSDIDETAGKSQPLKKYLNIQEKKYLIKILENCSGDKKKAANILDITLMSLYRKIDKYSL